MSESHARAVARCSVTAVIVGLASLVTVPLVSDPWKWIILALMLMIDFSLMVYLWLATMPEPQEKYPSHTQARIQARRKRDGS